MDQIGVRPPSGNFRLIILILALLLVVSGAIAFQVVKKQANAPVPADEPGQNAQRAIRINKNLVDVVAQEQATEPGLRDRAVSFLVSDEISAHMHIMGVEQFCPIHLHTRSNETTLIVQGQATFRTRFAKGEVETVEETKTLNAGGLAACGKNTGHECANSTSGDVLAALVIASPKFEGNLYVRENDPKLKQGEPCRFWDIAKPRADEKGIIRNGQRPLEVNGDARFTQITVADTVIYTPQTKTLFYTAAGSGTLIANRSEQVLIKPGQLVIVAPGREVRLQAQPENHLSVLMVEAPLPVI